MKKIIAIIGLIGLIAGAALAADWSNPNPRSGGDSAGQLLLKHESNMTDLYGATGKLNTLRESFAGAASPSLPETGQPWYDTTNDLFQVYDASWGGGGFYSAATSSFRNIVSTGTVTVNNLVTTGTATIPNLSITSMTTGTGTFTNISAATGMVTNLSATNLNTTGTGTVGALVATTASIGTLSTTTISGGTITGITDLAITDGGTGAGTKTAAFDNLAPTTTKGDLIAHDGTNNVRLAAGGDGLVLMSNSSFASGMTWTAVSSVPAGDAATLSGYSAGNGSGNLPISNGTVNTNLNADKVDGFDLDQDVSTTAAPDFSGISTSGTVTANKIVVTDTGKVANLNAEQVDGYDFNQDVRTTATPTFAGLSTGGTMTAASVSVSGTATVGGVSTSGTVTAGNVSAASINATGTIAVTSQTIVNNLNADMLDGQHGSYYLNASYINAGTLSSARGGTDGYLRFVGGTTSFVLGQFAGRNMTATDNLGYGYNTIDAVTTGTGNTGIGQYALNTVTTGTNNTALGFNAEMSSATIYNSTALGSGATCTASNQVRIGNSSVTSIGGYAAWSTLSDRRWKHDISDTDLGLSFVNRLRPVSFRMNTGNGKLDYGFIAQEVEDALTESIGTANVNIIDVADEDPARMRNIRYTELIAPLVRAVQELSAEVERLRAELKAKQ